MFTASSATITIRGQALQDCCGPNYKSSEREQVYQSGQACCMCDKEVGLPANMTGLDCRPHECASEPCEEYGNPATLRRSIDLN